MAQELRGARDLWRHSWSATSFATHWLQRFSLVLARTNYEMHRAVVPSSLAFNDYDDSAIEG